MNEKLLRPLIFIFVAVLHLILILFLVFETKAAPEKIYESARVMKLTDMAEFVLPPPLPPPAPNNLEIPNIEENTELMIETDFLFDQETERSGTIQDQSFEYYLPITLVSIPPIFDDNAIIADLKYPQIALRSRIEGKVLLELFVDRTGTVQGITIVREEPPGRGFGEAAVMVFAGRKGEPAYANGEPVSCRFRYPVTFTLK
ncbi:MAG: energy transducer TonB [Treponema sp.]|nr:energy transducer TonB [Treponema sp.]